MAKRKRYPLGTGLKQFSTESQRREYRKRQSFRRLAQPRIKVENTIKFDNICCHLNFSS